MIVPVSVQFQDQRKPDECMAIAVQHVRSINDIRDMRSCLLNLLACCLSSDEAADNFRTEDLYWVTRLIDAMTTTANRAREPYYINNNLNQNNNEQQ